MNIGVAVIGDALLNIFIWKSAPLNLCLREHLGWLLLTNDKSFLVLVIMGFF